MLQDGIIEVKWDSNNKGEQQEHHKGFANRVQKVLMEVIEGKFGAPMKIL